MSNDETKPIEIAIDETTTDLREKLQEVEPILQFFAYDHLPAHLKAVSRPFGVLAVEIVGDLPRNPERTVALRKLLEAKDAAVRARLYR